MAERLTELDCYNDYQILEENLSKAIDKLGKLEDILEKYHIDDIAEFEERLEDVEHYCYDVNKQFIDIMAKYNIKSVEELSNVLEALQKVKRLFKTE